MKGEGMNGIEPPPFKDKKSDDTIQANAKVVFNFSILLMLKVD